MTCLARERSALEIRSESFVASLRPSLSLGVGDVARAVDRINKARCVNAVGDDRCAIILNA